MKLEKRSGGSPEENSEPQKPNLHQKPVFIYIIILFSVAFALILLSFFMHQRSNQQVLGELKNNVNALEELQKAQDRNMALEKQLDRAEKKAADLAAQLESSTESQTAAAAQRDALSALYLLQQQYSAKKYDDCRKTIADMSALVPSLSKEKAGGAVSPAERYLQLCEAVENEG